MMTRPPPALLHASIAFAMASDESVPSPAFAPYFVISKSRFLKTGGLMRARIFGTSSQAAACDGAAAAFRPAANNVMPAVVATKERRFCIKWVLRQYTRSGRPAAGRSLQAAARRDRQRVPARRRQHIRELRAKKED